jgi:UDP-glucose 4-epimerase
MKFIVTGGAGFIGSHIAEALKEKHEVVIIDDLFSGKLRNLEGFRDSVTFVPGSITNFALVKEICEGADGIFHEAAIASVPRSIKNPLATNEANVSGSLNVLVAANECGVRKVVFASSSSVYGDTPTLPKHEGMEPHPLSPYAVSKYTGEQYMAVFGNIYGLKTVALRYFNVFGPRQDPNSDYAAVVPKFITRILSNQSPVIFGDGNQTRDFTYVKDVVQANLKAMESTAVGVFNIAYNQSINLNNLAQLMMEEIGKKAPIIYESPRAGDVRDSMADITRAKAAFNYEPEYTIRTGLQETIKWYMNQ